MNRKYRIALLLAFAALIILGLTLYASKTPALAQSSNWTVTCKGVAAKDRGLWFDMAGPGPNNEGALFWIRNRTSGDETCTATTTIIPGVSTDKYPTLRVRAAVNDGAMLGVQVFKLNSSGSACSELLAHVLWSGDEDNSEIVGKQVTITEKTKICMIKMTLTDDPDEIRAYWTNALLDEIRIWDGISAGWLETFTVTPP